MSDHKLWKAEDVIKVIAAVRGVDGRTKSLIIRNLTAKCHDASDLPESQGISAASYVAERSL